MATLYDVSKRVYAYPRAARVAEHSAAASGGITGGVTGSLALAYGTAMEDSDDGWVRVKLDTASMVDEDGDGVAECVCDTPISAGQRVAVLQTDSGQLKAVPIGDNIESTKVVSVVTQWAGSDSGDVAPTDGWSSAWPIDFDYVWQRTVTTYGDKTTKTSEPVCVSSPPPEYEADATVYASSATGASTAAKVATSTSGGMTLKDGRVVAVRFDYANTAASPTLNVDGTGARPIRTLGTPYAYWAAGATVLFIFDGTYWQTCSTPVYASTVTVGNPGSKNVYIDEEGMAVRNGTTPFATFDRDAIHLGIGAVESGFYLANDSVLMRAIPASIPAGTYLFEILASLASAVSVSGMFFGMDGDHGGVSFTRTGTGTETWVASLVGQLTTMLTTKMGPVQMDAGGLDLSKCDAVLKPAISIGRIDGGTQTLSSLDSIRTATALLGEGKNGASSGYTRMYRSGNYVYVSVPKSRGVYDDDFVPIEVSLMMRSTGVNASNFVATAHCERYGGASAGDPSMTSIESAVITTSSENEFAPAIVTPSIIRLPRASSSSSSTYTLYRLWATARSTNGTGSTTDWQMTVKML